jgi:hypothetical protein
VQGPDAEQSSDAVGAGCPSLAKICALYAQFHLAVDPWPAVSCKGGSAPVVSTNGAWSLGCMVIPAGPGGGVEDVSGEAFSLGLPSWLDCHFRPGHGCPGSGEWAGRSRPVPVAAHEWEPLVGQEGVAVPAPRGLFSAGGRAMLAEVALGDAYRLRVDSLVGLIGVLDVEVARFEALVADVLAGHAGYVAVQAIPGVGPVLAAVFVAEIGDVSRFASAAKLCSWAGLTPRHRECDTTVHRGHISKQGSRLVRWAAVEAVGRGRGPSLAAAHGRRVAERRGNGIGRVAAARKLLTLVLRPARRAHPLPGRGELRDPAQPAR